jgi:hypothetical protein
MSIGRQNLGQARENTLDKYHESQDRSDLRFRKLDLIEMDTLSVFVQLTDRMMSSFRRMTAIDMNGFSTNEEKASGRAIEP